MNEHEYWPRDFDPLLPTYMPSGPCGECGHDETCIVHGGIIPCNGWRTPCSLHADKETDK